ncbi:hypothetical protein ILUMI_10930 [Ignelater luminosus]|uniref:BTB domain-containing protein n=1 Tax=Ignelater luminosus TaxID=2038154 RepID=A0A8K0GD61_IGNLU|nr:hypothetical protein ILUMI_10930 [Ignelater luminosus]
MNKQEGAKTRYYVQWDTHARHMCTVLCSLMEHQSLVDLAICCGTNTIHAHKCVLAANSPYFREQLEKNAGTEQVVITGLDFAIIKSIIEFMYCGETNILDENLKYMIAAAKFFQMRGLQTLVSDHQDIRYEADAIHIPPPIFLPKKPKYPNAYRPLNNTPPPAGFASFKAPIQNDPYLHKKIKRKFVRSEAEKACAKEAAASRLALEALQKELATTTQMSSFVIEESCTETTVENFIPHTDETFIDNLNHIEGVPLQVVNYDELNNSILTASQMINIEKPDCTNNPVQFGVRGNPSKEKLKRFLGTNLPGNIEIMYRTNDGDFVNVTADVFQNLTGDTLQYQIVDEHGQIRELQEFQPVEQTATSTSFETTQTVSLGNSLTQQCIPGTTEALINTENEKYIPCTNLDMLNSTHLIENNENDALLSTKSENIDNHFIQGDDPLAQITTENSQTHEIINAASENDFVNISSSSTNSSPEKTSNNTSSISSGKLYEGECVVSENTSYVETSMQAEENMTFNSCNVNEFLNVAEVISEETKQDDVEGNQVLQVPTVSSLENNVPYNEDTSDWNEPEKFNNSLKEVSDTTVTSIDLTNENDFNESSVYYNEGGSGDCKMEFKKIKLDQAVKETVTNYDTLSTDGDVNILDDQNSEIYSPRKTRSSFKTVESGICQSSLEECREVVSDSNSHISNIKYDKPRRIMPNRKKKFF